MGRVYLMSVNSLKEEYMWDAAWDRLDEERREKVFRYQKQRDRLLSLGAGLLLQYGVQQWRLQIMNSDNVKRRLPEGFSWELLSVSEILSELPAGRQLTYIYNQNGKPYLAEGPYFSLSHSGELAACAVSDKEVGLDIQEMTLAHRERMAARFYTRSENVLLSECKDPLSWNILFYKIWTRKEAFGKLTGNGMKDGLNRCVVTDGNSEDVIYHHYKEGKDYQGCACQYMERKSAAADME